jgi:uncharacterized membrane protein YkvA (DUF1232 family)
MKRKIRELLLLIPNLLRLIVALLRDPRVSSADKAILAGTIIYAIAPLDILPDMIPFIGQVDDSYLIALSLLRLLNRADRQVVMEHWPGEIDIKELVTNLARVAEFFLPDRVKNVLRGKIERPAKPKLRLVSDQIAS